MLLACRSLTVALCLLQQKRDWPYNAEAIMKGRKQPSGNRSPKRKLQIICGMMRQILVGLRACHSTGADVSTVLAEALQTATSLRAHTYTHTL